MKKANVPFGFLNILLCAAVLTCVSTNVAVADLLTMFMNAEDQSNPVYTYIGDTSSQVDGIALDRKFAEIRLEIFEPGWGSVTISAGSTTECRGSFYYDSMESGGNGNPSRIKGIYYPNSADPNCPGKSEVKIVSEKNSDSFKGSDIIVKDIFYGQIEVESKAYKEAIVGHIKLVDVKNGFKFDKKKPCTYALWSGPSVSLPELLMCNPTQTISLLERGMKIPFYLVDAKVLYKDGDVIVKRTDSWVYPEEPHVVACIFEDASPDEIPQNLEWVEARLVEMKEDQITLRCTPAGAP